MDLLKAIFGDEDQMKIDSIDDLYKLNESVASQVADSALFYGAFTVDEFEVRIKKLIDQATERGYNLGKQYGKEL